MVLAYRRTRLGAVRNLLASPMTGYKLNCRHRRSRALYGRKVSNEPRGDSGRSRREIINRLAGLEASKECGVFRRTRSQEEFLKMPCISRSLAAERSSALKASLYQSFIAPSFVTLVE